VAKLERSEAFTMSLTVQTMLERGGFAVSAGTSSATTALGGCFAERPASL
jgi:hypothetical protein